MAHSLVHAVTPAARLVLAGAVALMMTAPPPAGAQQPGWLFPDRGLMPDLLAGPTDPVVKGLLVYGDPAPTLYGPSVSGEVAIAGTVPVLLLHGSGPEDAVVLGMEGAAFAHFSFAVVTRELVNTDWVFAVPLLVRRGGHWLRLRYYHTSSHLGDEYQRRYGPSSINWARDGVDATVYFAPAPLARWGVGVYGGGLLSLNSHPESRALWRLRGGMEVDPGIRRPWRPYGALDLEREDGNPIGWRATLHLGLWLPPVQHRPLRLALERMTGPSPMGQFVNRETRRVGLGLFWNP